MAEASLCSLSAPHKNRVRITLTLLDEALAKFEDWARGREVRSVFYQENNDLDAARRTALLTDIAAIRHIMAEVRDKLALDTNPVNVPKTIRSHCYLLWVDVMEITGKYLKGFGDPPPEMVNFLDARVYQILQYLDHLKTVLADADGSG